MMICKFSALHYCFGDDSYHILLEKCAVLCDRLLLEHFIKSTILGVNLLKIMNV